MFTSEFLDSESQPLFDGVRRLLHLAGADITDVDIVNCLGVGADISIERLSELTLTLGVEPRLLDQSLGQLMLESALFAFEEPKGALSLFVPGSDAALICLDPASGLDTAPPPAQTRGRALVFEPRPRRAAPAPSSLGIAFQRIEATFLAIIGITFVSNLLGLTLPLFTLTVYDQVLTAGDRNMLAMLVVGLALGVGADAGLRAMRSALLARSAAAMEVRLASRVFGAMLRSPKLRSELRGPSALARLREVDAIRNFVFGPVGLSLVEAPFSLVYVATLVLLGGWLAFVPLAFLVLGGGAAMLLLGSAVRRGRAAMRRSEEYGEICIEVAARFGAIKIEESGGPWMRRFRDASARLAEAEIVRQRTSYLVQILSGSLVSLAVLLTLAGGAMAVLDDRLSVGALIAAVALVWRMSAPLPTLLQARLRWYEFREARATLDAILEAPVERSVENWLSGRGRSMTGTISFSSVTFTYRRGQTPAIRNLSFEIGAGELVVVTGHSGAGKSTLLDLITGALELQFGSITIDGINPQQVSPSVLRQSLGYLPSERTTVPMAIRDFLQLGVDPDFHKDLDDICARLGLDDAIAALPDGDRTLLSQLDRHGWLARGIALARVLATNTNLILLDEPDASSAEARQRLIDELKARKGHATIVMATHEPDFVAMADRILVMNQGVLVRDCKPEEIVRQKEALTR